jgi:hypothetical protein
VFGGRDRLVRQSLRDRFVVTTHDEGSFSGLLMDADDTTAVFGDVRLITPSGEEAVAQGQVYVPRLNIAYMQKTD